MSENGGVWIALSATPIFGNPRDMEKDSEATSTDDWLAVRHTAGVHFMMGVVWQNMSTKDRQIGRSNCTRA